MGTSQPDRPPAHDEGDHGPHCAQHGQGGDDDGGGQQDGVGGGGRGGWGRRPTNVGRGGRRRPGEPAVGVGGTRRGLRGNNSFSMDDVLYLGT